MKSVADMKTESKGPEWVIRQGFACVCVQAPNAEAAVRHPADFGTRHPLRCGVAGAPALDSTDDPDQYPDERRIF